jgi:hypothetical protein
MVSLAAVQQRFASDVHLRVVSVEVDGRTDVVEAGAKFAAQTRCLLSGIHATGGRFTLRAEIERQRFRLSVGLPGAREFRAARLQSSWPGVRVRTVAAATTHFRDECGAAIVVPTIREPFGSIFEPLAALAPDIADDRRCAALLDLFACPATKAEHLLGLPELRREAEIAQRGAAMSFAASKMIALEHAESVMLDNPWEAFLVTLANDEGLLDAVCAGIVGLCSDSITLRPPEVRKADAASLDEVPRIIIGSSAASVMCSPPVSDLLDVATVPHVATAMPSPCDDGIAVGHLTVAGRPTRTPFTIDPENIKTHLFVSGASGSGKTTFVSGLCSDLATRGIPITVVEPAKCEYGAALANLLPTSVPLEVLTADDLRFNPLSFPEGIAFDTHRDELRSVLGSSLEIPPPGDFVLERMIDTAYREFGWRSLSAPPTERRFPTLRDVYKVLDASVERLGYGRDVAGNVRGAIAVRLRPLCVGRKGQMLSGDATAAEVMTGPTGVRVIELDHVRHPDEKAFFMGMLLVGLRESCVLRGSMSSLARVTVIEEAHHLLSQTSGGSENPARTRGLEAFANALAEVRAYGEGLVIADQAPSKLIRDVVRNTATKVCFRTLDPDDQEVLAGSLNLSVDCARALAALSTGEAFCSGGSVARPSRVRMNPRRG